MISANCDQIASRLETALIHSTTMNMQCEVRPRYNNFEHEADPFVPLNRPSPVLQKVQERWGNGKSSSPDDLKNTVLDESQHGRNRGKGGKTEMGVNEKKFRTSCKPRAPQKWDFGKRRTFALPQINRKNNDAATQIQRISRGGWQRIQYKVLLLQHRLNTRTSRTEASMHRVREKTEKRKLALRQKLEAQAQRELEKVTTEEATAQEGQQIIHYLRKENKKLRSKNQKIFAASHALKNNNDRLENANQTTARGFGTLNDHAKQIKETHDKLNNVVPKYKESVDKLREAVEERRQYCLSEHTIKLLYIKLIGRVVEIVEDSCKDAKLVDEIVGYCLEMEGEENRLELPKPLAEVSKEKDDGSVASSESDNYDEYTVATMD